MAEKFVLFEEAVKELKMSTDELKKLSEEGKIRSFMDSGKVKFRRSDLDALKTSMGITEAEDELMLAPPEEVPAVPPPASGLGGEDEVPPPPPSATPTYKEEEFSIEPLDDEPKKGPLTPAAAVAAKKAEAKPAAAEEEVASLSDFEITAGAEEQGQELSGEEAELLAMQGSVRGYEEAKGGNVGLTVILVVAVVVMAFGAAVLLSFPADINPFTSLTDFFNK